MPTTEANPMGANGSAKVATVGNAPSAHSQPAAASTSENTVHEVFHAQKPEKTEKKKDKKKHHKKQESESSDSSSSSDSEDEKKPETKDKSKSAKKDDVVKDFIHQFAPNQDKNTPPKDHSKIQTKGISLSEQEDKDIQESIAFAEK